MKKSIETFWVNSQHLTVHIETGNTITRRIMNTVKKTWPFEVYDFNIINRYVNDMANKGYALEKVGSLLASYKRTAPGAYKYCVDYIDTYDMNSDEYKKKWMKAGWEFIDYYDGLLFFRCESHSGCRALEINQREVRDAIILNVKKHKKNIWIQAALWIPLLILNAIIHDEKRALWIMLAIIQFFFLSDFFRYLIFKKNNDTENTINCNIILSKRRIGVAEIIKWIEKNIYSVLFIASGYLLIFKYKSYFLAKCLIVAAVIVVVVKIYNRVKEANEKRENKFSFESSIGKVFVISIGMLITIGVIYSFVLIDESKPKDECLHHSPNMKLECMDKVYYIEHDYGNWNYQYSHGITVGSEEGFLLPTESELDKVKLDNNSKKSIKISFLEDPDELEVRYWEKKKFENIRNYDEEYKTIEIKDGIFEPVDGEVVYAVYAKWKRKLYDGFGYYVFSG
nr:DUF2812 domain-containing protein [uncultured Aminipila sp.]